MARIPDENIIAEPDENDIQGSSYFEVATNFVAANGWYLLIGGAIAWYIYKNYIENRVDSWNENRREQQHAAQHHKDPDQFYQQQLRMETARRKLQEEHDRQAAAHAEKMKEREEKKREQKLEDWERHKKGQGYRSKVKVNDSCEPEKAEKKPKTEKKKLRDDSFNPLMGAASSTGYRSAARNFRGGG